MQKQPVLGTFGQYTGYEWQPISLAYGLISGFSGYVFYILVNAASKLIDDINKNILVRNKLNREKKTEEIEYTYEEFLGIYTKIQETIFSIVTGLNIFFANNYDEFNDFLLEEDREMSYMKDTAEKWRKENQYSRVAQRLNNMLIALRQYN